MKLLTFLGTGRYHETTYLWNKQEHTAWYAPVASVAFLRPEQLVVFLTKEAEEEVFPKFRTALPANLKVAPRRVPLGRTETELWDIFSVLLRAVEPGDEIAFDITHGLRSFPFVALLVTAYMRAVMNVRIQAVLYGAFEVRDTSVTPNRAPMFDLSPMLALLEWAAATDRFNRTGDARYLSSLLREQQKVLALRWRNQPEQLSLLSGLGNLAGSLEKISQALRLIRPHETMKLAHDLPNYVEKARPALQHAAGALPFARLLDSIIQTYLPLESTAPYEQKEALEKERCLIRWYAEREHWVQAAALAREWLVSWVMAHLQIGPETSSAERRRVEGFINAEADAFLQAKKEEDRAFVPVFLRDIPQPENLLGLWKSFTDVRNDILHAGMRDDPKPSPELIERIQKALEAIERMPLP